MIIKSGERFYESAAVLFALAVGMTVFGLWVTRESWNEDLPIVLGISIWSFLLAGYDWTGNCKTIILNSEGCKITLGPFKRTFSWDEMQTKKAENYGAVEAYVKNYGKGVYFAKRPLKGKIFKRLMVVHPLSSFRVFFSETKVRDYLWRQGVKSDMPDSYSAEEEFFLKQMKEWGIHIEPADKEFIGLEKIRRQMNVQPASVKGVEEDEAVD